MQWQREAPEKQRKQRRRLDIIHMVVVETEFEDEKLEVAIVIVQ